MDVSTWAQWLENVEPMAYGVLGLSPMEFGEFTPAELEAKLKGFFWKEEKEAKTIAWWLANICATQVGKKGRKPRAHDFYKSRMSDPQNPFYVGYVGIK